MGASTTFNKRQRERAREEHQREKASKKQQRKAEKETRPVTPGEDPDIAGIKPGPQPIVEDDI